MEMATLLKDAPNFMDFTREMDGLISSLERMMDSVNDDRDHLPLLMDQNVGRTMSPNAAANVLAGENMPNPLGQLADTGMAQQIAQTALAGGDANSPTDLGDLLAQLRDLGEQSPTAMMALLLGNALGAIDEQGIFGDGGMLEGMAKEEKGGGLLDGIGNTLGGIFGGGGGGGLLGSIGNAIGGIFGDDVGKMIGNVAGAFASGNVLGGLVTAAETIGDLIGDGNNPTAHTIGSILDAFQQNFGLAIADSV